MNATVNTALASAAVPSAPRLPGLGNLVRKDVREWLHSRRLWIVLGVSAFAFVGTAANAWINAWARANLPAEPGQVPPRELSLAPMDNLLLALGTQFFLIAAIFATMSLLLSERESGTLAWTVSKPVSRTSVLLSKWLTATVLLWITAVVVPAATAATVAALYGPPDLGATVLIGIGLLIAIAVFVAISIAAAVVVPSQAGVAAVGLAMLLVPPLIVGIVPALAPLAPTASVDWALRVALGGSASLLVPIATIGWLALLFIVSKVRFSRAEL